MKRKIPLLCLLLLLWMGVISCTSQPVSTPALEAVTVQLKWVHQAQFAGFYVAVEKGYYADENVDVTLHPGGVGVDIMDEVLSGRADFGLIGPEHIIQNRSAGDPVKAIATTYRNNPFVLVTMPDSGIESPYDFPGHSANLGGIDGLIQFNAMMAKLNLNTDDIQIVPYSYDLGSFYQGDVDITPAFAAGSLMGITKEHTDVNLIWPVDYGIHFYSDTLFATDDFITENPDLVLRFLRATLKGHRDAIENPEDALRFSMLYAEDADPDVQAQMIAASIPLIYTGHDDIGWMRAEVWENMLAILQEQDLLSGQVDMDDVYTMQFLEQIYGGEL